MRVDSRVLVACVILALGTAPGAQTVQRTFQEPVPTVRETGTAALSGVVIDADTGRPLRGVVVTLRRNPLGPLGDQNRQISDSQGRFVFVNLPAGGGFSVMGSKPGYLATRPDSPGSIVLADGQWIDNARVRLSRAGAITGVVTDEIGGPVAGVEVRALPVLSVAGTDQIASGPTTTTDDRGRYRIGNLPRGRYRVAVPSLQASVSQWSTGGSLRAPRGAGPVVRSDAERGSAPMPILDMSGNLRVALGPYPVPPPPDVSGQSFAYPPTFYPGTPSVTAATVLDVGSGSDVEANVQLRALPAGILRGVVEGPGQVANLLVRLLSDPALGVGLETATARTDAAGAFAFANVPAGDYVIEVPVSLNEYEYHAPGGPPFAQRAPQAFGTMNTRSWAAQGARPGTAIVSRSSGTAAFTGAGGIAAQSDNSSALWAREPVAVVPGTSTDVLVRLRSSLAISGTLAFEGEIANLDPRELSALVVADPADGSARLGQPMAQVSRTDPSRPFSITGVLPGAYFLRLPTSTRWTIKSIRHRGREYFEQPIDLSDGQSLEGVAITLTTEAATIAGAVTMRTDPTDLDGAEVVVFPADRSAWVRFGVQAPRMVATSLSPTGAFSVGMLPAGTYFVALVIGDDTVEWRRSDRLARLASTAERVTVGWGATANVTLRAPQ